MGPVSASRRAIAAVTAAPSVTSKGAVEGLFQFAEAARFGKELDDFQVDRNLRRLHAPKARLHDALDVGPALLNPAEERQAGFTGKVEIEDNDVRRIGLGEAHRFFGRTGGDDLKSPAGEDALEQLAQSGFVLDDQNARRDGGAKL